MDTPKRVSSAQRAGVSHHYRDVVEHVSESVHFRLGLPATDRETINAGLSPAFTPQFEGIVGAL